jgi:hypothetical protein
MLLVELADLTILLFLSSPIVGYELQVVYILLAPKMFLSKPCSVYTATTNDKHAQKKAIEDAMVPLSKIITVTYKQFLPNWA